MGLAAVDNVGSGANGTGGDPALPGSGRAGTGRPDLETPLEPADDQSPFDTADADVLQELAARLCREYATGDPTALRRRGQALLRRATELRVRTDRPGPRRDLLVVAGWTSLITACVEYDLDLSDDAERSRRTAAWVGREADHDEIIAWAYELGAWFALTNRRWREGIELAVAGQHQAPGTSAAVQLAGQEARGWARLGQRDRCEAALERVEQVLEALPLQRDTDHHFVIDPSKASTFRVDCYRWLGDDRRVERHAGEVLARWDRPDDDTADRRPMRVSAARLSLGVVAARGGDLDAAATAADAALEEPRRSLPWLNLIAAELVDVVTARWPGDRRGNELVDRVREVAPAALTARR
jgi:hypothetical protein